MESHGSTAARRGRAAAVALALLATVVACQTGGDLAEHDTALVRRTSLWREGTCAHLACNSCWRIPSTQEDRGTYCANTVSNCRTPKPRDVTGPGYFVPAFACPDTGACVEGEAWLSMPNLRRSECGQAYVVCYGGKQVSAMVRDNSADDGGGKRWEASEGVFAALEISGGNAPVTIYDDPTDPAIATDPECGPCPPGAHAAGGQCEVPDAAPEADAAQDAGVDAARDAMPDASVDAAPDAGSDASVDAAPDAAPDAGPDAGPDAAPDAGPDASVDAAPDAGPPGTPATSWGDPHLVTFDGFAYDFQAWGEFVLMTDDAGFEVQVRERAWGSSPSVAVNTAVAARVGGARVALYVDQEPPLRVDGVPVSLADGAVLAVPAGTITRGGGAYTIAWATGERVRVGLNGSYLDVQPWLPLGRVVRGLLPSPDGVTANDLTTRDGVVLAQPVAPGDLLGIFGASWRVTQAGALFDYPPGQGTADFTDPTFPTSVASTGALPPAEAAAARSACEAAGVVEPATLEDCVLDVVATGDPRFAASAVAAPTPVVSMGTAYATDFTGAAGPEWSATVVSSTPGTAAHPADGFLGPHGDGSVTLTLGALAPHQVLTVRFDVYVWGSWDGNAAPGPDRLAFGIDGATQLETTFSNFDTSTQAYPDSYPTGSHPGNAGALEVGALGFTWGGAPSDAVYRMTFTIPHSAATAALVWTGAGLQTPDDEAWGIDNVQVSVQ